MSDLYKSPGLRCKKHRQIGISYCNVCAIELERADNDLLRAEVTLMTQQIEDMGEELLHLFERIDGYE